MTCKELQTKMEDRANGREETMALQNAYAATLQAEALARIATSLEQILFRVDALIEEARK